MVDRVRMAVLDVSEAVYVVLDSVVPKLLGGAKLLELFDGLGLPAARQRVVCNRYSNFAGNLKPADVAERLGRPVDYILPSQKKWVIAGNIGRPFVLDAPTGFGFGRAFKALVGDIVKASLAPPPSPAENGKPADAATPKQREAPT